MAINTTMGRRTALAAVGGAALAPLALAAGIGPARAAAPMMGPAGPTFYRFKLGGFEVTTLLEAPSRPRGRIRSSARIRRPKPRPSFCKPITCRPRSS
jgi:hypothetical protein